MSRIIKFRAWDGKMIPSENVTIWNGKHWDMLRDSEIVGSILMQFTGLHDKNGKEIYDGDILKSNHFHDGKKMHFLYHRIIWDQKHTGWMAASSKSTDLTEHGNVQLWVYEKNAEEFEIIGNIHENPELLNN